MYFSDRDDMYKFEEEETHIQKECVITTFDDPSESDLRLERYEGDLWVKTDPNYSPLSECEEESEEESVVDSEEEEEEED